MTYSPKFLFIGMSLAVSCCDTEKSTEESVKPATLREPEAPQNYTLSSDDRKILQSLMKEMKDQVFACRIEGGSAYEFQAFLESKGLRSRFIGDKHTIIVHRDDLDHFLIVADNPEVIARYGLSIRPEESKMENKPEMATPNQPPD